MNHHTGSGSPDYGEYPEAKAMFLVEATWFAHRTLWQLIYSGRDGAPSRSCSSSSPSRARRGCPRLVVTLDYYKARMSGQAGADGSQEHIFGADLMGRLSLEAERVLGPPVPGRVELHPARRGRDAPRGRRRPDHVGERLPAPRGVLAVQPRAPAPRVRRRAAPTRSRRWSAATRRASTASTWTPWRRSSRADRADGGRGRRAAPGRVTFPDDALRCPAFALASMMR